MGLLSRTRRSHSSTHPSSTPQHHPTPLSSSHAPRHPLRLVAMYLLCPQADGTQHFACITNPDPAHGLWNREPSYEEQRELLTQPPDLLPLNARPWAPTGCHFDRLPGTPAHFPAHVIGTQDTRFANLWYAQDARILIHYYTCSIHHVPPIVRIRTNSMYAAWNPILQRLWTAEAWSSLTPEEWERRYPGIPYTPTDWARARIRGTLYRRIRHIQDTHRDW